MNREDQDFALSIYQEYNEIPFEALCQLIDKVRNNITIDFSGLKQRSDRVQNYKKLSDPEVEIKELIINTNKGKISISASDSLFPYMVKPIQRINYKFNDVLKYLEDALLQGAKRHSCNEVMKFIDATSLIDHHKHILIGKFIVHFKFYKSKKAKTQSEWEARQTAAIDYPHYLADLGKTRLKTLK